MHNMRVTRLLLYLIIVMVISCQPISFTGSKDILIKSQPENIKIAGGNEYIIFDSGEDWWIETSPDRLDWIAISDYQGLAGNDNILICIISPNNTYETRTITISICSNTDSADVVISQSGNNAILLSEKTLTVSPKEQTIDVSVKSNVEFEVKIESDWINEIKQSKSSGLAESIRTFSIKENESMERTAQVVFHNEELNLSDTLTIIQSDPIPERRILCELYNNMGGAQWTHSENWCTGNPLSEWYGISLNEENQINALELPSNNISGEIPDVIFELPSLEKIDLSKNTLTGKLDVRWSQFENLRTLNLSSNHFAGNIPAVFDIMFGNGIDIILYDNYLSGNISNAIQDHPDWNSIAFKTIRQRQGNEKGLNYTKNPVCPVFSFTDIVTGEVIMIDDIIKANERTVLFHWNPTDARSNIFADSAMKRIYSIYADSGLEIVALIPEGDDFKTAAMEHIVSNDVQWIVASDIIGEDGTRPILLDEPYPSYQILNNNGTLLIDMHDERRGDDLGVFGLRDKIDIISLNHLDYMNMHFYNLWGNSEYESSDYSMDKYHETIQISSKGKGIDLVLMGEAFTDVDIESGFYRELMMRQYETIFSIEPMKTYKDYFNVHIVYAVAPKTYVSEDPLKSAFHTEYVSYNSGVRVAVGDIYYGETLIEEVISDYALLPCKRADINPFISILLNGNVYSRYKGQTYMWEDLGLPNVPLTFYIPGNLKWSMSTMIHETIGHGIGRFGEEYRGDMGSSAPDDDDVEYALRHQAKGWIMNLSGTDNPEEVPWAHLIGHPAYSYVGVYSGAGGYNTGIYKSERYTIMDDSTNYFYFAAWCRELLVRRIIELAGGEFSFEEFVANDSDAGRPFS